MPSDSATSTDSAKPIALARWALVLLLAALAVHAGLLAWALANPLAFIVERAGKVENLFTLVAVAGIVFLLALSRWPRHGPGLLALGGTLTAAALVSPGPVLVVALTSLNSCVIGDRVLARIAAGPSTREPLTVRFLVGVSIWMAVISITAAFRVHIQPVYVVAVALPLVLFSGATLAVCREVATSLTAPRARASIGERVVMAVVGALLTLHIVIVARPEIGYDAVTVHLQYAQLLAHANRFDFDVTRWAWAVMPLGADQAFAAAFLLGGEAAARLCNLVFGLAAAALAFTLAQRQADRLTAWVVVALLASMPLGYLVVGSLFSETAWCALLLGTLLAAFDYARHRQPSSLVAMALLCGGAMATKVLTALWLVPLLTWVAWRTRGDLINALRRRAVDVGLLAGAAIGAWPYANAWVRTGNPVFPFMNAVFRSRFLPADSSFNNPLYNAPLTLATPYELVLDSGRFVEGMAGAAGIHWLLLIPLLVLSLFTLRTSAQRATLSIALVLFVGVYLQQSYLRYLLPSLIVFTILCGWALAPLLKARWAKTTLVTATALLCLVNVALIYTASYTYDTLCLRCGFDRDDRTRLIATYAPDRIVADYLTENLPNARIGFFVVNGSGAAGYAGYSRAGNWHDLLLFPDLVHAETPEELLGLARKFRLTHVVTVEGGFAPKTQLSNVIAEFRERYTESQWRFAGRVVGQLK